jgi:hypothetical protein
VSNLLDRIAQEEEEVVLDRRWKHRGRVIEIKLKRGVGSVGSVGGVGTESPNGHHNTTETLHKEEV